jgi:hypothetical protein
MPDATFVRLGGILFVPYVTLVEISMPSGIRTWALLLLSISVIVASGCGTSNGSNDAGNSDGSSGALDLVVEDFNIDHIPPREVGNVHYELSATAKNIGSSVAEGLSCRYKIEPLEMQGSNDTWEGEVPFPTDSLEPGETQTVQVEVDRDAESGQENYEARFQIRCFADNETASGSNNVASLETSVLFY